MNRPLIRFVTTALIATLGIASAFAGSGGGTRIFVGESIPVVDKAIVKPAPQPQPKNQPPQQSTTPAAKPTPGPNPTPGPDPKPGPKPRPTEVVSVVYYTDGFEMNIGQPQQTEQKPQPQAEQVTQKMPGAEQIQVPVTPQVEQPVQVQQLPQPIQETSNEPIIIMPRSVNAGNGSQSKRRSNWTYGVPGMTGGEGNGPLIYNP